jgi:anti-sigma-K factor RskA
MNLPADDDLHILAGAYAINALDDLERARFERHLDNCETCQDDVAGFSETTGLLASAAAAPISKSLHDAVHAQTAHTQQVPSPNPTRVRGARRLQTVGIAAAAILALGIVSIGLSQRTSANRQSAALTAVTQANDAQTSRLVGTNGTIQVTYSANRRASVLIVDDLPPAPAGRVYELWLINGATAKPAVTFQPKSNKRTAIKFEGTPTPGTVYAVSEEPAGGSDAPTTTPTHISQPI